MNLELRPFRPDDLDSLVRHASHPSVAANLTDSFPNPFTEEAGRAFIEMANKGEALRRCIAVNGECAGAIGLHPKQDLWRNNLELGYWLAVPYRGQGIMSHAIRRMVTLGFEAFPAVTRIYATPFGSNIASRRALEKAGFVLEATLLGTLIKNGVVQDELIYAVRRGA
ncbi:MAG: GNAT family N-acetyltransferase [Flavobacteriales bacterium]|nr:GNAT family N-acetyltransferase [Flavobacteriales bacterium]HPF91474.1 GNAT family protein [Flavobacteriales bacterium]